MKLKYILNEAVQGVTPISNEEELIALIKINCQQYLPYFEKRNYIFRGFGRGDTQQYMGNYALVDPKKRERKSINIDNYYTLIMDNAPAWINFPKRKNSLICFVNDKEYHHSPYGKAYVLFPFDNAKFGICPQSDIWLSFSKLMPDTDEAQRYVSRIKHLFSEFGLGSAANLIKTYADFKECLTLLYNNAQLNKELSAKKMTEGRECHELTDILLNDPDSIKWLEKKFDPNDNEFVVGGVNDLPYKNRVGAEVWTDSECFAVKIEQADHIYNLMFNQATYQPDKNRNLYPAE